MANFKPDMSWRDDERVQRVTEQPSGGAHEQAAETPDVRVNMRPNGQATEQSAGQAQQTPGRSTSRIPRPARQPNGQAAERANEAVSRLGGVRALVVLAAVVVIGAVAAFAVIGGVGDVQGGGGASSSASKETPLAPRPRKKKVSSMLMRSRMIPCTGCLPTTITMTMAS